MIGRKIVIKADIDTQILIAFITLFGFFAFLFIVAQVHSSQEHYWDVRKAQRSCESDFESKSPSTKNLNYNDCSLIGTKITDYEIAKEVEYCYKDCSQVKEKYLYWQKWEKSCQENTYANDTCHSITDTFLNHFHF